MSAKAWLAPLPLGFLLVMGCNFPVRQQVDDLVCKRADLGFDTASLKDDISEKNTYPDTSKLKGLQKRLKVPEDVPGAEAPLVTLKADPNDKKAYKAEIESIIKQHFPPIPKVQLDPDFPPGPDGRPLTLKDLEHIAFTNSPLLRQSASDVEAARGNAIQAGAYPNPTLGYSASGNGPSGGPTVGMNISQTIITMGKRTIAQAAAIESLKAYELAYRRAETDLMYSIRTNYYAVLVAQESIRANRGLVELTDEMDRVMVDLLRGGQVAPGYEVAQIRVFSAQARTALVSARNARMLAWKQLAASMGTPFMPPTALVGNVNRVVPALDYEKALAHVLSKHTDALTTATTIAQARYNLRLSEVTAYPDVTITAGIANDLTNTGPSRVLTSIGVSIPVPVWDRNRGGIMASQAALVRAIEEPHRVQADLTSRFSEAYRRYKENRVLMKMYIEEILPAQVTAFRAAIKNHDLVPGQLAYLDVVASEQNLVMVIPTYLGVLTAQWQAVADVSNFLQTDQIYRMVDEVAAEPPFNLEELLKLPCHHPCSSQQLMPTREAFAVEPAVGMLSAPVTAAPQLGSSSAPRPTTVLTGSMPTMETTPRVTFLPSESDTGRTAPAPATWSNGKQ